MTYQKVLAALTGFSIVALSAAHDLPLSVTDLPRARAAGGEPIASYSFDEAAGVTATDVSGNGNDASLTNGTSWTEGKYGSAIILDGIDDGMMIPGVPALNVPEGTVSFWFKTPGTWGTDGVDTANKAILFSRHDAVQSCNGMMISVEPADRGGRINTALAPAACGGNAVYFGLGSSNTADGSWHHVAVTFEQRAGGGGKLYVDGVLEAAGTTSDAWSFGNQELRFGGSPDLWWEQFAGQMDNLRIYDYVLSAGEVVIDRDTPVATPDVVPPVVSLTAPADGSGVTGMVTLAASASDAGGIAGVQFILDGQDLGPEDTSAPYEFEWNTGGVGNGTHILGARARDESGNVAASATVSVTLTNTDTRALLGEWSAPAAMPLVAVHQVLLPSGKVLMWEGPDNGGETTSVFNPVTGAFEGVPLASNLFCSGHAMLADGTALVLGGDSNTGGFGIPDVNAFDFSTQTWSRKANMAFNRWYPTGTTLANGNVYVSGGSDECVDGCYETTPELYDVSSDTWTTLTNADFPEETYYPHTFVLKDGRIFRAGSEAVPGAAQILDLNTQTWSTVDPRIIEGGSSVMYAPGKVMKAGKIAESAAPTTLAVPNTYVIDMNQPTPRWRDTAPMNFSRVFHVLTLLPDGTTLATGGGPTLDQNNDQDAVLAAEIWNPDTEVWTTMASGQRSRLYHGSALLLPDGRVLVAGGGRNIGTNQLNYEFYSPPYLFKGARPAVADAPGYVGHGQSFVVETPDAASVQRVTMVRVSSMTHSFNSDQRFLDLSFSQTPGGLSVQAPENPNEAPPGYYMLFLINGNGVPSLAHFIRLPSTNEDSVAPSAPANLVASGSVGAVMLSWEPSTDNAAVSRYNIHRSVTPDFTPLPANRIGESATASYMDVVDPGTYYYFVTAEDPRGNISAASQQASGTATADSMAPAVSVTAPAQAATVRSFVQVSATATDNVSVAGVQFLLDGQPVNAEDTEAPYSISWNTGMAGNGEHVLTARARDAAGNQTVSGPVTVTVSNMELPSVIASYSFDEGGGTTGADLTGNGHTATLVNGTAWASGQYGSSLLLDGVNDTAVIPSSAAFDSSVATWSFWVKAGSWGVNGGDGNNKAVLLSRHESAGSCAGASLLLEPADRGGRVALGFNKAACGGDAVFYVTGTSNIVDNGWHHIAVTFERQAGGEGKLYVDGALEAAGTMSQDWAFNNQDIRIGSSPDAWWEEFGGQIDNLRIYDRVLSEVEIQTDMNTGVTRLVDGAPPFVALTAPSANAIVTGTVSVTAAASDSGGVAGVQFYLDGQELGAEDTVAPYAIQWDTTSASQGAHVLTARARDGSDNETTSSALGVTVVPRVTITAPAQGSTVQGTEGGSTVTINYAIAGQTAVGDHLHFELDNGGIRMDLTPDGIYQWTGATSGPHTFSGYIARGNHGRISGSEAIPVSFTIIVPDAVPPSVSLTAPPDGSTVNGSVLVTAGVSDNIGVAGVQFLIDGLNLGSEITTGPYAVSWNTGTVGNGSHVLTARARDAAGNVTVSAPVTVTVENVALPGVIASYSFDEGAGTVSADLTGNGHTAALYNGITWAAGRYGSSLVLDGVDDTAVIPSSAAFDTPAGTWSFWVKSGGSWETNGIDPSNRAMVLGRHNGQQTCSGLSTILESAAMGGKLIAAASKAACNGDAVFYQVGTSNAANGSWHHIAYTFEQQNGGAMKMYVDGVLQISGTTSGSWAFDNQDIRIGSSPDAWWEEFGGQIDNLRIYNRALSAEEVPVDMGAPVVPSMDETDPAVSITAPAGSQIVTGTVTVTASVTDAGGVAGVQFLLDGQPLGAEDAAAPYSVQWNTADVTGPHELSVRARDIAGNVAVSQPVTVTVVPHVVITSPVNGSLIVGSAGGRDVAIQYVIVGQRAPGDYVSVTLDASATFDDTDADGTYVWTGVGPGSHSVSAVLVRGGQPVEGSQAVPVSFVVQLPDEQAPSVSLVAPADMVTVNGTVIVSANASDNTGVAGVQFLLDGANLGAEVLGAPYAVSWNTGTVGNGSHVLTARARDAAGNVTLSSPVTVIVDNPELPGLIAAYSFDEASGTSVSDGTGNGHGATLVNGTAWAAGRYGSSLVLDGDNDTALIPSSAAFDTAGGTWSFWVKSGGSWGSNGADPGNKAVLLSRHNAAQSCSGISVILEPPANGGRIILGTTKAACNGDAVLYMPGTSNVADNAWHHVAVTFEQQAGGAGKIYVDGILQASGSMSQDWAFNNQDIRIGSSPDSWWEELGGQIDNLRIYNRVLSPADVVTDMNAPVAQ